MQEFPAGATVREQRLIPDVPTMSVWNRFLYSRHCAEPDRFGRLLAVPKSITDNRAVIMEDGAVRICCIGCGCAVSRMDCKNIRVGMLIQMDADPIEEAPNEFWIPKKVRPVTRDGLGCFSCQLLLQRASGEVMAENEYRNFDAVVTSYHADAKHAAACGATKSEWLIREACKHGMPQFACSTCTKLPKRLKVKLPNQLQAYIDVLKFGLWEDEK